MIDLPPTVPSGEAGVAFAFAAFGRRIGISLWDAALLAPVAEVLPAGWRPVALSEAERHFRLTWLTAADAEVPREGFHLSDGDGPGYWVGDRNNAVTAIETEIEHDLAEFAHPWLFMHAGVVAWDGGAIVLPGTSHAGKSTLTAALVEAGATYFSDEYAVLDREGRVRPFPRRLSLREGPLGPAGRLDLRPAGPPACDLARQLPIRQIYVLRYERDCDLQIETLPPGASIMELCQHMVAIQRRPQDVLTALNTITKTAQVFIGKRGDARETARQLLARSEMKPPPPRVSPLPPFRDGNE